jgi:hypothetical protein
MVTTMATECSNCHSAEKVLKLPTKNLCYGEWHLEDDKVSTELTMSTRIYHTGCLYAETWRKDFKESGWPSFVAILHERYAPGTVTLKCEACHTTIKHCTGFTTPIEDY